MTCKECNNMCRQGRDCPNRTAYNPPAWAYVATAVFIAIVMWFGMR